MYEETEGDTRKEWKQEHLHGDEINEERRHGVKENGATGAIKPTSKYG